MILWSGLIQSLLKYQTKKEEKGVKLIFSFLDPERILDFYVTISKNGKTSGVLLECVTMDSSVNINQIHFSEEIATYTNNYFSAVVNENYSGPEFKTLDERLQQEFLELFIQLGIDDNLGSFIEVISVDKDQRLYINWLKNVEKTLI